MKIIFLNCINFFLVVSVYLKCLGEKGLLTSDMLSIWKKSLLKV